MKFWVRLTQRYAKVSAYVAVFGGLCLLLMVLLNAVDAVARYGFNAAISIGYELSEFFLVVLVFLSLGLTASQRGHVNIMIFRSKFSPGGETAARITEALVTFVIFGLFTAAAFTKLILAIEGHWTYMTMSFFPQSIPIAIAVVSFFSMCVRSVIDVFVPYGTDTSAVSERTS